MQALQSISTVAARARFTTPYEGPPGCVHGAVIAGAFDQVFNIANLMSGTAGPTAELTLRYRNPTPLHREVVFEAQIEEVDGRKIRTTGRLRCGDTVTVEASGLFIGIGRDRAMALTVQADE